MAENARNTRTETTWPNEIFSSADVFYQFCSNLVFENDKWLRSIATFLCRSCASFVQVCIDRFIFF